MMENDNKEKIIDAIASGKVVDLSEKKTEVDRLEEKIKNGFKTVNELRALGYEYQQLKRGSGNRDLINSKREVVDSPFFYWLKKSSIERAKEKTAIGYGNLGSSRERTADLNGENENL